MSLDFSLYGDIDLGGDEPYSVRVFETNITHNLGEMAKEAGIYKALWGAVEEGYIAGDIVDVLSKGLADLRIRPKHYRQFDACNGWGSHEYFTPSVASVLEACQKYPKAKISVSK